MTLEELIIKYNGKYVDFDGVYGAQCMDLLHIYCVEVLGITDGSVLAAPAAKDVYLNFSNIKGHELFDQIANTPTGVPSEGDIVLWGTGIGAYGHVAIFHDGDSNKFKSFDQNFPTGSPCHIQDHTYTGVLGWLHPKEQPLSLQAEYDKCRIDRDRNWTYFVGLCDIMKVAQNYDVALLELKKLVSQEDLVIAKDKQLFESNQKIVELQKQLDELTVKYNKAESDNLSLATEAESQRFAIEKSAKDLETVQGSLQELKDQLQRPAFTGLRKIIYDLLVRF